MSEGVSAEVSCNGLLLWFGIRAGVQHVLEQGGVVLKSLIVAQVPEKAHGTGDQITLCKCEATHAHVVFSWKSAEEQHCYAFQPAWLLGVSAVTPVAPLLLPFVLPFVLLLLLVTAAAE